MATFLNRVFKNNGDVKYTDEKVTNALEQWKPWGIAPAPAFRSINSRMISKDANTTFLMKKKYFILPFNSFPNHYYLSFDDKVWHPGNLSNDEIFTTETSECCNQLVSVIEKCYHCTYHHMRELFFRDKKFNIFTNNCQNILGQQFETCAIFIYHMSLIINIITGSTILFAIGILTLTVLIIYEHSLYRTKQIAYNVCPHIKTIHSI